ncbi:hypothetical protein GCM10009839_33040 [Catenulispora yoronensis]|uniref:Uncharacterized protein n=1 Tax=Catenulispora yoronensis TaxID=450799 RepID=A0ABN2U6G7_9ACTN
MIRPRQRRVIGVTVAFTAALGTVVATAGAANAWSAIEYGTMSKNPTAVEYAYGTGQKAWTVAPQGIGGGDRARVDPQGIGGTNKSHVEPQGIQGSSK